ncbi:MAG: DUF547 domain-containing protein [Gemmatimonadaceae bacterium]|nr:DUF547 domain-containing protein [Gemmatimonadaceae bacterium]
MTVVENREWKMVPISIAVAGLLAITAVGASGTWTTRALAQPGSSPGASTAVVREKTFEHALFDALLKQHVVKGFVDYPAFAAAPAFSQYLRALDAARLDGMSEDERLAFWINVFNAYTIQLINAHNETASIRNINKTLGVLKLKGPWNEPLVRAAGRRLSLDDVYHRILRKEFAEPRTHFTLACGAVSCASLRPEAYTGAKLVDQLNEQGMQFLRHAPDKTRLEEQFLWVSPIIMAYQSDFGASRREVMRALAPWFDDADRKKIERARFFMRQTTFDWTLNSVALAKQRGKL